MRVQVRTYSGYKADERPTEFVLNGRHFRVVRICDRWLGPDASYFKVRADDENYYIFEYRTATDEWSLTSFRSHLHES